MLAIVLLVAALAYGGPFLKLVAMGVLGLGLTILAFAFMERRAAG